MTGMMTEQQIHELPKTLHGTTDALVWAEAFVALHGGDVGLMIGWFANAIEVGRDAGRDSPQAPDADLREAGVRCATIDLRQ